MAGRGRKRKNAPNVSQRSKKSINLLPSQYNLTPAAQIPPIQSPQASPRVDIPPSPSSQGNNFEDETHQVLPDLDNELLMVPGREKFTTVLCPEPEPNTEWMAELQLPRRMFKTGCEPCGQGKVHNYFNLHWIETIKNALELDTDYKMKLEESQFRNIMQMGQQSFSDQFLHYLLTLQLETTRKSELWWTFAGKPIRYAIEDFALVTGLNCNPASKTVGNRKKKGNIKEQVGGEIYKSLFGKLKNEPTPLDILDILNNKQCKTPLGRFKLVLLLIVEGILCPTSGNNYIRGEVVDMLDDIEEFLEYPWGRESFTLTVESVKANHPFHYVAEKSVAVQGFAHAMVLVTVCSCPAIISLSNVVEGEMEEHEVSVEDILKSVLAMKLLIDVKSAKNLNQRGQAKVKPLLVKDRWEESLRFKEMLDPAVDHMLALIADDFPFELNTWTGGVTEEEAKLRNAESADRNDETLMEEGTNPVNERVRKRIRANKTDENLDIPVLRQIVIERDEQLVASFQRLLGSAKENNDKQLGELRDVVRGLGSKVTNMENKIIDLEGRIFDEIRDMKGEIRKINSVNGDGHQPGTPPAFMEKPDGKEVTKERERNSTNGDQSPAFMEKTGGKEGDFDEEAAALLRIPRKSTRQKKQPEKLSSGSRMPKPKKKKLETIYEDGNGNTGSEELPLHEQAVDDLENDAALTLYRMSDSTKMLDA